jgi:hypothetical protein
MAAYDDGGHFGLCQYKCGRKCTSRSRKYTAAVAKEVVSVDQAVVVSIYAREYPELQTRYAFTKIKFPKYHPFQ